ncbi:MAG: hypothetical protein OXO48_12645 [Caldilineaceae bacterium]|nr:hypothetical protein [Caldilineaceae bacterium]
MEVGDGQDDLPAGDRIRLVVLDVALNLRFPFIKQKDELGPKN